MANYFSDNEDLQFLLEQYDLAALASTQEEDFADAAMGRYEDAPVDAADAVDNYRRILWVVGEIAGSSIADHAETVDREGNTLNDDGTVTLHPLLQDNLEQLRQADLMGMTLPRRYGGLNCPTLIYTMAVEMVSRADASLMNLFGLQGIAETIWMFADDAIKDEVLPRFCRGEVTGAMALTEPDAGSDLQAIRLRATQDDQGQWRLNGVKRFITNGCGDILLTLARSEPEIADGRGLSLFLCERSEHVRVRHLESKLGIHGSPTCELVYENAPARLIGQRQRGLTSYVLSLMNGARVGIAAQSLGIAEAAYRLARGYAHARQQFGGPIERIPAVAEMLVAMRVEIEAARALLYETAWVCDQERDAQRRLERAEPKSTEWQAAKQESTRLARLNAMLTPMSKYYASEMCCRVADTSLQVLGGSGYMRDYAAERLWRDARITTIYEGTSQLQIVAAVRAVASGVLDLWFSDHEHKTAEDPTAESLQETLCEGKRHIGEAIQSVRGESGRYLDLSGRRLVDAALTLILGQLLVEQGQCSSRKRHVAQWYLGRALPMLRTACAEICAKDLSVLDRFEELAGPPPSQRPAPGRGAEGLYRPTAVR